jgi:glycosyltransferase involved in cell wall biosynthesis
MTRVMNASEAQADVMSRADARAQGVQVLYLLNNLSLGGSEAKIVHIANALADRGVRVGVAHLNTPDDLAGRLRPGIPVWCLQRRGMFSLRATGALRRLLREQKPIAVIAVNLYPTLYASAAAALLRPRPRTIGLVNTIGFREDREWQRGIYRWVLGRLDLSVYGSEVQRSMWVRRADAGHARSRVIYNGVDLRKYQPVAADDVQRERERHGIGVQSFVVGTVGRLAPEKNQVVLVETVAQLRRAGRDVHLLLVGDGRLRAALEQRVAELDVAAYVHFAGALQDVRTALSAMDVFVLPSRNETFSNAALEAMAMSRPVILSRVGGAGEMVSDGIEGYTIPVPQLAAELPTLIGKLQADPALCGRLGAAARRRVEREFPVEAMVDEYQALLGPAVPPARERCEHA